MTCAVACVEPMVTTPFRPLAVGATFHARFQYAKAFDCTSEELEACPSAHFIESISSVEIDDASLFAVDVPLTGDTFSVKALRVGQTAITVNGLDVKGVGHSGSAQFRSIAP